MVRRERDQSPRRSPSKLASASKSKLELAGKQLKAGDVVACEESLRALCDLDVEPPAPRKGFPADRAAKLFELVTDWAFEAKRYKLAMFACMRLDEAEERMGEPPLGRAFTWGRLGTAMAAYGQPDKARDAFERGRAFLQEAGTVKGKSRGSFYMSWAMAMYDAERYGDASEAYREALRAVESDPDSSPALVGNVAYLYGNALLPCVAFGTGMEKTISDFRAVVDDAQNKGVKIPRAVKKVARRPPENSVGWRLELVQVLEKAVALLPPDDDTSSRARDLLVRARALAESPPVTKKTRATPSKKRRT